MLERYMLLARELQHRTKNLLAVIQSIASVSLSDGAGREAYLARLHALGRAQDLLLEGDGRGASIKDLVAQILDSFGQRVTTDGPPVHLSATTAQGFALILHELATNAAKHGALSVPTGKVTVHWLPEAGSRPALRFRWCERGGPPALPPTRKGFGTTVLEVAVPSIDRLPRFHYSTEGFEYELRAVLDVTDQLGASTLTPAAEDGAERSSGH